ncbi:zinc finger protein 316 [Hypomesus transpacificus]|uniref:zinc finger protein 316 n=1 Tax=Hypomesus transpacificus TaxID=137520 RepID=UPI001F072346|nr:zinc finger protein 316 [Hypomesus transpacificus]
MAAVHSLESQVKQGICSEKLEEPGVMTDQCEPESTCEWANKSESVTFENSFNNRECGTSGDGFAGQNEPLSNATAGADVVRKDSSVVDLTCDYEKVNNIDLSSKKLRLDWSETEDDAGDAREYSKENGIDIRKDNMEKALESEDVSKAKDRGKDTLDSDEDISPVEVLCDEVNDRREEKMEHGRTGSGEEKTVQTRKKRLVCKECGKIFTRRETFNLHRHFHTHEGELASLTCKECGLSFQHRSTLIKHRSEHKEKEQATNQKPRGIQLMTYPRERCKMTFSAPAKLNQRVCNSVPEKPYRCPLCRKEFFFKCSMTKHIQSHSLDVVFHCQECNKGFSNGIALRCHQRCHSALKPYECPDCGMVFRHYSVMEDHRRKHKQPTRPHQCHICSKTFKYGSLLHQHQYLHTGQKPFRCQDCGKTFAFAQNLKAHCRQHKRCPYACPICPLSFPDQESLQTHVTSHSKVRGPDKENNNQDAEPKRIFNCPLCPQTYVKPADLRGHMLIHEAEYEKLENGVNKNWENAYTCPHCPLTFPDQSSLCTHLSTHGPPPYGVRTVRRELEIMRGIPLQSGVASEKRKGEDMSSKPLKCPDCGKAFRHRSVLELHMRIHSKDKPYQCNVCHKSFRFNNYLQQHLIIHTGEKPYKCPDCGKDFAFLQNMRTHLKLHQQKPFRCTQCRKGYSDESQLQRHMLSHNGDKPHKCQLCDKSFGIAYLLRDHMNTHTGERPHRCQDCHKSFPWLSSLLVHQKIHTRKHQSQSYPHSFPLGIRIRSRGRRGPKFWPKMAGGSTMVVPPNYSPYQVPMSRGAEWERKSAQPQVAKMSTQVDIPGQQLQEQWMPQEEPPPVQWQVEGGQLKPVSMPQLLRSPQQQPQQRPSGSPSQPAPQQRSPGWAVTTSSQPGPSSALEPRHLRDGGTTEFGTKPLTATLPKYPNFSDLSEAERQRHPQAVGWGSTPTAVQLAPSSQHSFSVNTGLPEVAALWSVRPSPVVSTSQSSPRKLCEEAQQSGWPGVLVSPQNSGSELCMPPIKADTRVWNLGAPQALPQTVKQSEIPWNVLERQSHWSSGLATSAQMGQNTILSNSTPSSPGMGNILNSLGISKTLSSPEKTSTSQGLQSQQKQLPFGWTNVPTSSHKVPLPLQYDLHRFPHGVGPVWGFQNTPVGPQILHAGTVKPRDGQQQPMITGTGIIINQTSPFLSPPLARFPPFALPTPHPLHSVAVGSLSRPPHPNIFFTPQAIMSERPHIPQALQLPQLAPQTEPHKIGGCVPFAPDRLLQCMICGYSLPRELDLQMHYLQHAQGEI